MRRSIFTIFLLCALFVPTLQAADEGPQWLATWTPIYSSQMPSARAGACMVFDKARSRVVLFGGHGSGISRRVWEWNGASWSFVEEGADGPRGCSAGQMVYDHDLQAVVVHRFDGDESEEIGSINSSWTWEGGKLEPHSQFFGTDAAS